MAMSGHATFTTADSIQFQRGTFDASVDSLTFPSWPIERYVFSDSTAGSIQVENTYLYESQDLKSLSLLGSGIDISYSSFLQPVVVLASVGPTGEVHTPSDSHLSPAPDGGITSGGDISLANFHFRLEGWTDIGPAYFHALCDNFSATDGAINALSSGTASGGEVYINALDSIELNAHIGAYENGPGEGPDVRLVAGNSINLDNAGLAARSHSYGTGDVGQIMIEAPEVSGDFRAEGELVFQRYSGDIFCSSNISDYGGLASLIKAETGTLTFSGTSTYGGDTTVAGGTLALTTTGSLMSRGTITTETGTTLVNHGVISNNGVFDNTDGTFENHGRLEGNGTFIGDFDNTIGTLAPGNSAGTMEFAGDYTLGGAGVLEIEIGGFGLDARGRREYDFVDIAGQAFLQAGGTIALSFLDGYDITTDLGYGQSDELMFLQAGLGIDSFLCDVTYDFLGTPAGFEYDVDWRGNGLYFLARNTNIDPQLVPVPGAALLGLLGLSSSGWLIRQRRRETVRVG